VAEWRGATLTADPGRIVIEAPGFGRIEFLPEDVLQVELSVHFPLLDQGVRIRHVKDDVARRVRFTSWARGPDSLARGIRRAGFVPRGREVVLCLECGAELPDHDDRCRACGWTFAGSAPTGPRGG
jgi:hypothetical protein